MRSIILLLAAIMLTNPVRSQDEPDPYKHGVVFFEEGRFGGWPANNGVWSWGDEIVVGFTLGYYKVNPEGGHPIDSDKPSTVRQARSLDGGETWNLEIPSYIQQDGGERPASQLQEKIDFTHPHFAVRFRNNRFYYSYDRCRTWSGPFLLPDFGRKGLLARTDYIVNGKHDLLAFLAAEKDEGGEGWPCCIRTQNGGLTWEHIGWIGEQPGKGGYSIMPSTLRINDNSLLSIIRRRDDIEGERTWWIEGYLSPDNGRNWYLLAQPTINNHGNPPHMIYLKDHRIVLTYGYREKPYGIRAVISSDQGKTWSDEIILRSDGGGWDLGYPRTVQRSDGKCVTIYYFNDGDRQERYIAFTLWEPKI
ncbi:MAG: sialidase family protein [Candidatus Hinthialibacter sp.]